MDLAKELLFLAIGFVFLAKGSDWLVAGGSTLAARMGIRPLVVGLTVVAWGTSAPELVVSGLGATGPTPEIAMGNVLGSNVANIGLVLGVCAMILPKVLEGALAFRESFWLLGSVAVFYWVTRDLEISRVDGGILLGALTAYNLQLFLEARKRSMGAEPAQLADDAGWFEKNAAFATVLGGVTIATAAWLALEGATGLATRAGIDEFVISMSVLAIGTSLPELAAGITGALKGHSDISVGNVVGSNVFNILGVIGVVALIHPLGGDSEPHMQSVLQGNLDREFPVVFGFSLVALFVPMLGGSRAGRLKGFVLLAGYVAYMTVLFSQGEAA